MEVEPTEPLQSRQEAPLQDRMEECPAHYPAASRAGCNSGLNSCSKATVASCCPIVV